MRVKQRKEVACMSVDRTIPSTSATQFPDNTKRPFWSLKEQNSASDDFFDCYVAFKECGCQEYFWDWRGRKIDELVVKKLMNIYKAFFRERPIGRDCFITLNVQGSGAVEDLGKLYLSIISSNDFATGQGMFSPPIFEVVHSSASPDSMLRLAKLYNESVGMATDKLKHECGPKYVSLIPTHDFGNQGWYSALNRYISSFQNSFRCRMGHLRPIVPRASLADRQGFVASVLATRRVLSSYASFSKITGVDSYPIVEAAPLLFRGGLSPGRVKEFIRSYPGARTVTLTPSFRYDYDLDAVKSAIGELNHVLPKNPAEAYTRDDLDRLLRIEKVFARHYAETMKGIPSLDDLPKELEKVKRSVDSRLERSFSFYSLGIPPELIGTGNAILECIKEGLVKDLEKFYPGIKSDLKCAGALLNRENLKFLADMGKGWKRVMDDVRLVDDYTDSVLGPQSTGDFLHRNHTSNVFHLRASKMDFANDLLAAAKLRHCMG